MTGSKIWLCGLMILAASNVAVSAPFLAGEDSQHFRPSIGKDEKRGELPETTPLEVKSEINPLLNALRGDSVGLSEATERNLETYFIVADAFESDGLLLQSVDTLSDLLHKLEQLKAARAGKSDPLSMIATEDDILAYRDCHNLHVFDSKYMAGAQPTEKGYRWLRSKGVTTVINLRVPSEHEQAMLEKLGIKYVHIAWADEHPPTVAQVHEMLDAVKQSDGKVMQHCLRGIGRDMTMAGCYVIANQGKSADDFIAAGRKTAPRWEADQKIDPKTGQPLQFQLLREFERQWKAAKN
jgi:protein tyrosine phosphatase (PTP) superfamily phosphohydrolase (DUF442 family)